MTHIDRHQPRLKAAVLIAGVAQIFLANGAMAQTASPTVSGTSARNGLSLVRAEAFPTGREDDHAVPLDWSGPAARMPGADAQVESFNPGNALLTQSSMCVETPGQPAPACASAPHNGLATGVMEVSLSGDMFNGGIGGEGENPDQTCQTIETVRRGSDGQPQRVFASVCGEEVEMWNYRSRSTPSSSTLPIQPTDRAIGPNQTVYPAQNRPN